MWRQFRRWLTRRRMWLELFAIVFAIWLFYVCTRSLLSDKQWDKLVALRWTETRVWEWHKNVAGYIIGCNYIPSTAANTIEMWRVETFNETLSVMDRELRWASRMGMNVVRVFLHPMPYFQNAQEFMDNFERFLQLANSHNIRVIPVFFDDVWNPNPKPFEYEDPKPMVHNSRWVQSPGKLRLMNHPKHIMLKPYVQSIMQKHSQDQRVLLWDLYNEPGNPNINSYYSMEPWSKQYYSAILLHRAYQWARQINPTQPITTGVYMRDMGWTVDLMLSWFGLIQMQEFSIAASDVISFHSYARLPRFIEMVERLKLHNRPLLCTEYMARTAEYNSTIQTHLPYAASVDVGMINWGLVKGRTQTIFPWDSWTKEYHAEPALWFHDLLQPNGTAYNKEEVRVMRRIARASNIGRKYSDIDSDHDEL